MNGRVNPAENSWTIGVDLGGTKIEAALVSATGKIRERTRQPTGAHGDPEATEQQVVEMVEEIRSQHPDLTPMGVGIGVAGQISAPKGRVRFAPNLEWRDVPLQSDLEKQLDTTVAVLNDVRAATWGEWLHGAGQECEDLICIFVGTGVGGGVVSGGHMLAGASNTAGEIGHITVDLDGPDCHCGNKGCLEAMAGGWAIGRHARRIVSDHPEAATGLLQTAGGDPDAITARTVAQAFHQHDRMAERIVDSVAHALGAGLVTLVNALNPRRIILGGGVIDGLPELPERVQRYATKHALGAAVGCLEIVTPQLKDDAVVVGAAAMLHGTAVRKGVEPCASA